QSAGAAGVHHAINEWRSGGAAAEQGWEDAGVRPPSSPRASTSPPPPGPGYSEGMLVRHDSYGVGRVTGLSGYGAMRRVKGGFSAYGEKTFVMDKVKLAIVRSC